MSYTRAQYDEVMREYSSLQLREEKELEERIANLYAKYPDIKQIRSDIIGIKIKKAKLHLMQRSEDKLDAELSKLVKKRDRLYQKAGIGEEDFEPRRACDLCGDTGVFEGRDCKCFRQKMTRIMYRESNLRNMAEHADFSEIDMGIYSERPDKESGKSQLEVMTNIIDFCEKYCDEFDEKTSPSLYFYGPVGTGKTFLSNCIARRILDGCHSVIYFSSKQFFDLMEDVDFRREEGDQLERVKECDLLILDDLGTEVTKQVSSSELFEVINTRLNHGRPTIISTNMDIEQIKEVYDVRIASRIRGTYKKIGFKGRDLRYEIKKSGGHANE